MNIQNTEIIIFVLVFIRIISFLGVSPVFMIRGIPNLLKAATGVILTYLIYGFVSYNPSAVPQNLVGLISAAAGECLFGVILGFMTTMVFQAIRISGQLLDIQAGFSMLSEFDINLGRVSILGNFTYLTGLFIFFLINGHHVLIRSLIQSFSAVPVFGVNIPPDMISYFLTLFQNMMILSLKLAAPVVVVLFLTDFTMGLISRTVPQLNVLMIGLSLKTLIGVLILSIIIPELVSLYIKAFEGFTFNINDFFKLFPVAIVFASSDKTEEPTPKKIEDARKKGQVPKSREFVSAIGLICITIIAISLGDLGLNTIEDFLSRSLVNSSSVPFAAGDLFDVFMYSGQQFIKVTAPLFAGVMTVSIAANIVQTGFIHSTEPLKPKLSRLNPIEGFKRMFSGRAFFELLKSSAIIVIVGYVIYSFVIGQFDTLLKLADMGLKSLISVPKSIIDSILVKVSLVVCVLGIIDLIYQKRTYTKEMRMTKEEVKEEFKQTEGDPKIKSAIRQRQREIARRRMMQQVPKATVVITNPTHLAVALRYEQGKDDAPYVVAKGADEIAQRIKEIAKENNVPIVENKFVARLLYKKVEIDDYVPFEMYQVIAEILAQVYKLNKNKSKGR
ncbi:MAG: flagellar biosynthesis protein FlhB [Clostridiales bacterium]|nr:flagellar biosynthesis protein FlhB [Clostridiales bacterium]HBM81492.1 flagellar biosynthetic protein FlhB [Clostridiaceae bacterium]